MKWGGDLEDSGARRLPGFVSRCKRCRDREETIDALLLMCGALFIGFVLLVLALCLSR